MAIDEAPKTAPCGLALSPHRRAETRDGAPFPDGDTVRVPEADAVASLARIHGHIARAMACFPRRRQSASQKANSPNIRRRLRRYSHPRLSGAPTVQFPQRCICNHRADRGRNFMGRPAHDDDGTVTTLVDARGRDRRAHSNPSRFDDDLR